MPSSASSPSTTHLVLVAEDEPSMLELVSSHLKSHKDPKLDILEASDGEEAWAIAREQLEGVARQALAYRPAARVAAAH